MFQGIKNAFINWLIYEPTLKEEPPSDFRRLKYEIKPGDVLLVEGRSRIARIIRNITFSSWTHAMLYIGRLADIESEEQREYIKQNLPDVKEHEALIIESLMEKGICISRLASYRKHHIRICRPIGLIREDALQVVEYAFASIGKSYNVRQLVDLARFLLPWSILPRRWHSSLFYTASGEPENAICSTLIAEAFDSVKFPILPFMTTDPEHHVELYPRNPHLFTPKDFDYSPYFEIIKYPLFNPEEPLPYYRRLPWTKTGLIHQDYGLLTESMTPPTKKRKIKFFKSQPSENSNDDNTDQKNDQENNPT